MSSGALRGPLLLPDVGDEVQQVPPPQALVADTALLTQVHRNHLGGALAEEGGEVTQGWKIW